MTNDALRSALESKLRRGATFSDQDLAPFALGIEWAQEHALPAATEAPEIHPCADGARGDLLDDLHSPSEDSCPGCNTEGTMTAACPKCGGIYKLIACADLPCEAPAPQAPAEKVPDEEEQVHAARKLWEVAPADERAAFEGSDQAARDLACAFACWWPRHKSRFTSIKAATRQAFADGAAWAAQQPPSVDPPAVAPEPVRAALAELVALKDLKLQIDGYNPGFEWSPNQTALHLWRKTDYDNRQPLAWAASRAALAAPAPAAVQGLTVVEIMREWVGANDDVVKFARAILRSTQSPCQPLTDEQIDTLCNTTIRVNADPTTRWHEFARAIERAHGIGPAGQEQGKWLILRTSSPRRRRTPNSPAFAPRSSISKPS